ncbi:NAD(P)-dependent oxidoreductase [Paracoccus sp. PAR01]|uniref:NAD-dependent epimerase/dehydratase family protein n=1 Tax=Paracoccus sp. PAR01 TaxID=2769282 RepID=UPI001785ECEB|nr:NAD-dependent epimerase/dehydratase family protein [Paracoccus sp. PAR01]MBD9527059.1 NAD-dependent epimerase/dehydratase family protein [Paracoccus sp. PAR01]
MTDRTIFITGANGYVGRNLIRHFIGAGRPVIGMVRNQTAAERVAALGARPVIGDMLTSDLTPLMQGADHLIHAAANLDHGAGRAALAANRDGTARVMASAQQAGIGAVVHISTDSVLQAGMPLRDVNETAPYPARPAGAYSAGKAEAERIALQAAQTMRVMILRPRMVWGRDDGTALPTLATMVRNGRFAWISNGNYLSSTTHIANLCHAVDLALERGQAGRIYHITDGPARPFRDVVTGLMATQDLSVPEKSVPRGVLRLIARFGDVLHRFSGGRLHGPLSFQEYATSALEISLNTARAQRELGYAPVISWEAGLEELRLGSWSSR